MGQIGGIEVEHRHAVSEHPGAVIEGDLLLARRVDGGKPLLGLGRIEFQTGPVGTLKACAEVRGYSYRAGYVNATVAGAGVGEGARGEGGAGSAALRAGNGQ